jgi:Ca-activated chloride channel family protein
MFRFENTYMLYLLPIVLVIAVGGWLYTRWQRNKLEMFSTQNMWKVIVPERSSQKQNLILFLFASGIFFLIFSLANPQIGSKLEEVKSSGVDILIALDVSNSMRAEDLRPSRLEHATQSIARFIEKLENDRVGLVVFAGDAYVQLPITSDYQTAKLFLEQVNCNMVPTQGTAVGAALEKCIDSFDKKSKTKKSIILMTDGENFEDDATAAAAKAAEMNIQVHCIGMGSPEGVPIPEYAGGSQSGYKKDAEGNTVITRLDEASLQQIAASGKGLYVRDDNSFTALERINEQIQKLDKTVYGGKIYSDYESRYMYMLIPAFVLLLAEILLSNKKNIIWDKLDLFHQKKNP